MEDLPQGFGIRLPIDASMVKGVPAPTTLFTDNTLHRTTGAVLHQINLPPDRIYRLGARFSVRTTNSNAFAMVGLRVRAKTALVSEQIFDTPYATTYSTTFTMLQLELVNPPLLFAAFSATLSLTSENASIAYAESQYEELVAITGKLVGD